ncbi:MAG: OpgC domain-containing protein [Pseudomonadota bacterium]
MTDAMTAPPRAAGAAPARAPRDVRLDVFRGLAMFIIFVAHVPGNAWTLWIPARFGFSDATEIFVFCSGMASAIAFGGAFSRHGWWMGTARIAHRVWQVYWCHICLFIAIAALMAALNATGAFERDYVGQLNLYPFFRNAEENLIGLVTLTYVPNYFDILPMYLVILAMIPLVMGLAKANVWLVGLFVTVVWALGTTGLLELPAEPWSERNWFFNPFAWQLVFFTGFAFMRGWLKPPPVTTRLVVIAAIIVLATVPLAYFRILGAVPELREVSQSLKPLTTKTGFGILRYVHFLALAYLAWVAVGPMGRRLVYTDWRSRIIDVIRKVGQQSLAIFITSMILARIAGFVLDQIGRNAATVPLVNLAGFAILIGVAYAVAWFKAQPWKAKPATPPAAASALDGAPAMSLKR